MNIYQQIRNNNINTWIVMTVFVSLLLFLGFGFDYFYGARMGFPFFSLIALGIGVFSSFTGYFYGDQLVLSSSHAREPDLNDPKEKQWVNVVEEMSVAAGLPMPKVYVIDDPDPNAFATGRDPNHSSIAATQGLLDVLNREELQGVASHEMSHVRNYDTRLMLIVAVLVGSVGLLANWAGRMMYWGRGNDRRSSGPIALVMMAIWLIAIILAPILSQIIAMCVSRSREYLADASGAELTRNPMALASALAKISGNSQPSQLLNQGTSHLCIADPMNRAINSQEGMLADLFATHPPIEKRIEALKQMSY